MGRDHGREPIHGPGVRTPQAAECHSGPHVGSLLPPWHTLGPPGCCSASGPGKSATFTPPTVLLHRHQHKGGQQGNTAPFTHYSHRLGAQATAQGDCPWGSTLPVPFTTCKKVSLRKQQHQGGSTREHSSFWIPSPKPTSLHMGPTFISVTGSHLRFCAAMASWNLVATSSGALLAASLVQTRATPSPQAVSRSPLGRKATPHTHPGCSRTCSQDPSAAQEGGRRQKAGVRGQGTREPLPQGLILNPAPRAGSRWVYVWWQARKKHKRAEEAGMGRPKATTERGRTECGNLNPSYSSRPALSSPRSPTPGTRPAGPGWRPRCTPGPCGPPSPAVECPPSPTASPICEQRCTTGATGAHQCWNTSRPLPDRLPTTATVVYVPKRQQRKQAAT